MAGMTTNRKRPRGACTECGHLFMLTGAGLIRHHVVRRWDDGVLVHRTCDGTGKPPWAA